MPTRSILIVDDDENLRNSLAMILQKEGFRVLTAGQAGSGLQLMCSEHIDLIFLDLGLPDRNGLSLLPHIRQKHPDLPILILTANPAHYTEAEAAGLKIQGYLMKPIDPAIILEHVRTILLAPPT